MKSSLAVQENPAHFRFVGALQRLRFANRCGRVEVVGSSATAGAVAFVTGMLRHERYSVSARVPAPGAGLDTPPACTMSSTARRQFV